MLYLGPDPIPSRECAIARSWTAPAQTFAAVAPRTDTHWSRILCYDLAAGDDCRPDEPSLLVTQSDPRHEIASRGKRIVTRALTLVATCVALYLAAGAFFRASTLPNAAAAVVPQSAMLQSAPPVSDFPVDVRPPAGSNVPASTSDDRDSARECVFGAGVVYGCNFH